MPALVLRLQTNKGVRRLTIDEPQRQTIHDLKLIIANETGLSVDNINISFDPPTTKQNILNRDTASISSYQVKNGAFVYLTNSIAELHSIANQSLPKSVNIALAQTTFTLTPQCQHNELGRCLYCDPSKKNGRYVSDINAPLKCTHGPGVTCMNCCQTILQANTRQNHDTPIGTVDDNSQMSSGGSGGNSGTSSNKKTEYEPVAAWLCSHPSTSFCPKCIPAESKDDDMSASTGAGSTAGGLTRQDSVTGELRTKVNFLPFKRFLANSKPQCASRHDASTTCPMCLPPSFPSYAFDAHCSHHAPWPAGQCTKCMPNNVALRLQKFRHVDGVEIPQRAMEQAYKSWLKQESKRQTTSSSSPSVQNGGVKQPQQQQAFLLFGRLMDEVSAQEDEYARRAVVAFVWQLPQKSQTATNVVIDWDTPAITDAIKFAYDMLKLKPIGWLVMTPTLPTDQQKYGGKVLASAENLVMAAQLQWKYSKVLKSGSTKAVIDNTDIQSYRLSEFVFVQLEHCTGSIEPQAYMISDQGMCMSRDGALLSSPRDPFLLGTPSSAHSNGTPIPSIIFHDDALPPNTDYIPDSLLVKVRTMTGASNTNYLFQHYSFPSQYELDQATIDEKVYIREFLKTHSTEPSYVQYSDFNLLFILRHYLSPHIIRQIATCVKMRQPFDANLTNVVRQALTSAGVLQ